MVGRWLRLLTILFGFACLALAPKQISAQGERQSGLPVAMPLSGGLTRSIAVADVDLKIQGPNGLPIEGSAMVTLIKLNGEIYKQSVTKNGYVRFNEVAQSEYNVQVVAPGFGRITKQIDVSASSRTLMEFSVKLEAAPEGEDAATDLELAALPPKAQKSVGKAIEALRSKKLPEAKNNLESAYKISPKSAEVNYLYGIYSQETNDRAQAKAYWTKAIELYPNHYRALLSLSQALLDENKPADAVPYLKRAERSEPASWRAHAIAADAYYRQGLADESVKEAERAMELGHGEAAVAQRYLAAGLAKRGETDKALTVLQDYIKEHPTDADAKKQLDQLQAFLAQRAKGASDVPSGDMVQPGTMAGAAELPMPASWLPPDVDERIPPVETAATCSLDDVVKKAGERIEEFVQAVDRFAAIESMRHETINKWGLPGTPEMRKFDYIVSIQEPKRGFFNVEEFRTVSNAIANFPDGVESNGLPALVLIFHPSNVVNFDLTCEGLAKWNGALAWQVHFRQRADKPNTVRSYKVGVNGVTYPIALKGRVWIEADNYQIVRLETDLVKPIPEIRLVADHTAIEYGPVHFKKGNVDMWLPQSAELYSDSRGRRFHRTHTFSKYMLFSIDDKQHISAPREAADIKPGTNPETDKPNR